MPSMRLLPVVVFLLCAAAHAQLADDFGDGDFTQNPAWQGDAGFFQVSAQGALQANGPAATSAIGLSTPIALKDSTVWEFRVALGFAPSGSNYLRIYLLSDQANLKGSLNGYYVRIGEDGTADGVDLFRQQGAAATKIIDGTAGRAAANPVALRIRVVRGAAGNWRLFSQKDTEPEPVAEGTASDDTFWAGAGHLGLVCQFTTTNRQRFAADDFLVTSFEKPKPPPIGFRDLVITELLPDESPRVELPAAEFVELHNATGRVLNLKGCTLADPTATATLPDVAVAPHQYVILCRTASVLDFMPFGHTVGVPGFPSLNNSGDEITLRNPAGQLVDRVRYTDKWYGGEKAEGGWSLEQIDTGNPCGEEGNWTASTALEGGTPGRANATSASKPDLSPPVLLAAEVLAATRIRLVFDEKLDSLAAAEPGRYRLEPAATVAAVPETPGLRAVVLSLAAPLAPKTLYTLSVQGIKDCNQNLAMSPQVAVLALPEPADSLDVVLNEVLFDPKTGGVDFVEVFNRSDKFLNLNGWQLANTDNGVVANRKPVAATNRMLPPQAYAVFTTDAALLAAHYPKGRRETVVEVPSLPTYPDDAGTVVLLDAKSRILDRLDYADDWHFRMLQEKQGVSLERLAAGGPTNAPANWHSAAATEGYATPGHRNSQGVPESPAAAAFRIEPRVITPNEDGYQDFAALHFRFDAPGQVATVTVFDVAGRPVRRVAANLSLAAEGFFTWDGTDEAGRKVRSGRYVVAFSVFNLNGSQQLFKEDVAVSW